MKRYLVMLTVLAVATSIAVAAGEGKKGAGKKIVGAGKEMTLKGKVLKFERQIGKGANPKMQVSFYLFQADGVKVKLPENNESVNLDDFVDKTVDMVVLGGEFEPNGVKEIRVAKIVSVKAADDKPASAPATTNASAASPKQ